MVNTGGAIKKFSSVSWCCFHFPVWTNCSLGLFSCVELHFGLLSAVEKLMYLQDCGFVEMFVTISSMSALVKPLPAWAFMCIFKLCTLKNGFMHISHAESLSAVSSDNVDLQTLPTLENFCTSSVFVSTSPKSGLYPVWAFMCIFKLFPLESVLAHSSHAESLSSVCSDHVDLQTLPTYYN